MDREQLLDRFEFNYDRVADKQIDPIADVYHDSVIMDRLRLLSLHIEATFFQFMFQTGFIGTLQQSGAKFLVDLEGGVNNLRSDDIYRIHGRDKLKNLAFLASWRSKNGARMEFQEKALEAAG